ncbi:uncharacterized protein LOC122822004 [Gambusia affinis]|uniref:uncharacterized protein LOC122822004 n=1 Tax=Gambusia affinis TaxID=33528 RepID=UPI001CDD42DB|nr:uncharacterized protein LOC122822004 [Gambusia affinis]
MNCSKNEFYFPGLLGDDGSASLIIRTGLDFYFQFHFPVNQQNHRTPPLPLPLPIRTKSFCQIILALSRPTETLHYSCDISLFVMATADQLVKEIFSWITQGENYADKLKKLAGRLESEREQANAIKFLGASAGVMGSALLVGVGAASVLTGGLATPLLALGAAYTGGGAVACACSSETEEKYSKKILSEARDILNRSNEKVTMIQELFEKLKKEKKRQNSMLDPKELDNHVLADVLMAVGRHRELDMSNMNHLLTNQIEFSFANGVNMCGPQLGFSPILVSVCAVLLMFNLKVGSKSLGFMATFGPGALSGGIILAGAGAMAYFLPEAVDSWNDLIKKNYVTEASRSLRSRAEEILKVTRELREQFNTIEESLRKLSRIKFIIEKKNRNQDEKRELIDYAIKNSPYPEVKQWLIDNAGSDVFCHLVNLGNFIKQKLYEEAEQKTEEDWKWRKIELVFLAHGSIENRMIPARCLMPLPSITDVLLYSPWNCLLYPEAAYSIATGSIQPDHRLFGCANPGLCYCSPETSRDVHVPLHLPSRWNSMRDAGCQEIPNIMVSPVAKEGDPAFADFIALRECYGTPTANRYLVPYLAPEIGRVPFFIVTLAISLVLLLTNHEATVHLAACLGKSPRNAVMQEERLSWQYSYTVDNTGMTVPRETIQNRYGPVFNMFKAVFGDESPFF